MHELGVLLLSLLFLVPRADARSRARAATPPENKYLSRLMQKCEDGQGQSCFDYAQTLKSINAKANEKKIKTYTRRACVLAYAPACGRQEKPERARMAANAQEAAPAKDNAAASTCGSQLMVDATFSPVRTPTGLPAQQVTRLQKGSVLEKAGVKVGDLVTKVNGSELGNSRQFSNAMDDGGAMIEVSRGSSVIPLALRCP